MKKIFYFILLSLTLSAITTACGDPKEDKGGKGAAIINLATEWQVTNMEEKVALFPHAEHQKYLKCSNCHDSDKSKGSIFRKYGSVAPTKEQNWAHIYCGACHNEKRPKIASDCKDCHNGD